jgi:uncharacterized membrane protein
MKKLNFFWNQLTSTFWFVPSLIIVGTIAIAIISIYIDGIVEISHRGIGRYLFIDSADSARSILTTISGAMIGVAGTVFSITLVALTLASSQFGPRLIKNFMYDRLNQVVLGSYVATYIYCLIVLNTIKENGDMDFLPSISILLSLFASLSNIILLIVFIHHIATTIQADKVISDISESLNKNLNVLFPEKIGEEHGEDHEPKEQEIKESYSNKTKIKAPKSGYLQYINNDSLLQKVNDMSGLIELHYRPGDYIVYSVEAATIFTNEELSDEQINFFTNQIIISETRNKYQDAEHSIHQMVEIAVRALSPGVNDPYTAISCIDNLTSTMCYLTTVKFPSKYRYNEDGDLRVIADALTYEGMLDAAFNQIRQFASGSPSVVIRLLEALITIHEFTHRPYYKRAVKIHAKMVLNMASDSFDELNDFIDVKKRSQLIFGDGSDQ